MIIVKRLLLNNLFVLLAILPLFSTRNVLATQRTAFLILNSEVDILEASKKLEESGSRIKQSVPPNILVVQLGNLVNPSELPFVKTAYGTSIPIKELKTWGAIAMAAGIDWNRSLPHQEKSPLASGLSAMSAAAVKNTLPAPEELTAEVHGTRIECQWEPAPGALLSEIQVARDQQFNSVIFRAKTDRPTVYFPIPDSGVAMTAYIQVRHIERPSASDPRADLFGPWSIPVAVKIEEIQQRENQSPPVLSSPLDEYKTSGFTLILEWTAANTDRSRIQLCDNGDFSNPWMDVLTEGHEFVVPSTSLHVGDVVYWRVQTYSTDTSPWSASRQATIGEPSHHETDMFINPEAPQ